MNRKFIYICLILLTVSAFADEVSISVRLSNQKVTAETLIVSMEVEYIIPPNMYQSYNQDFFYFTVEGIEVMIQDVIKYPEGQLKDGTIVYFGKTILSNDIQFPVDLPPGSYILQINAGYQLCDLNGMCFFPEEEKILLEIEFYREIESTKKGSLFLRLP